MVTASEKFGLLMSRGKHLSLDHGLSSNSTENVLEETFCQEKLEKGILFFKRNFFSIFVSMMTGQLSLVYIDTIVRVLDATNKRNSPALSFLRFFEAHNHVLQ